MELNNMYINATMLDELAKELTLQLHRYFEGIYEHWEQKKEMFINRYCSMRNTLEMLGITVDDTSNYGIELSYKGHTAFISQDYFEDEKNLQEYLDNRRNFC